MKSQELQSLIDAHVCENCEKYIYSNILKMKIMQS